MQQRELFLAICDTLELLADDPELDGREVNVFADYPERDQIRIQVGYDTITLEVLKEKEEG